MLTLQQLTSQSENIQNDLLCVLDGLDNDILDNVCQVIVDRFNILKGELMPLLPGKQNISENIRELIDAGYPQPQAIAIAISYAKEHRKRILLQNPKTRKRKIKIR